MQEELKSMQGNEMWGLVGLLDNLSQLVANESFKTKWDSKRYVERLMVDKCYTEREGIDFNDTFSPVSSKESFKIV